MSLIAVQMAFDIRLALFAGGAVAAAHQADIQSGNQAYEPKLPRPYYSARISAYDSNALGVGVGAGVYQAGTYQITVNRAAGEARVAGLVAAALAQYFWRATPIAPVPGGATQPAIVISNATERPAMVAGGWISIPVLVNWFTSA